MFSVGVESSTALLMSEISVLQSRLPEKLQLLTESGLRCPTSPLGLDEFYTAILRQALDPNNARHPTLSGLEARGVNDRRSGYEAKL